MHHSVFQIYSNLPCLKQYLKGETQSAKAVSLVTTTLFFKAATAPEQVVHLYSLRHAKLKLGWGWSHACRYAMLNPGNLQTVVPMAEPPKCPTEGRHAGKQPATSTRRTTAGTRGPCSLTLLHITTALITAAPHLLLLVGSSCQPVFTACACGTWAAPFLSEQHVLCQQ